MNLLFTIIVTFFAGMGAGLGTGFAGMSAAAVISPMLITFLGMDPYMATVDAGDGNKVIVEIADRIADDDLELARLGESALGGFQCLDLGNVCLGGIVEDKSHTRYAVGYCRDVLLAANVLKQQPRVLFVFTHNVYLLLPGRAGIFELVQTSQVDLQKNHVIFENFQHLGQENALKFRRNHGILKQTFEQVEVNSHAKSKI